VSDSELGAFLRARREAVAPEQVGLPAGLRRRTPGLRRAELATLAGISVEYLTRIEQGRDRHPSAQVLSALADALRLSVEERGLLRHAAKVTGGGGVPCGAADPPAHLVRATVRALLDRLEPEPAYVVNRLGDILARTSGYERLAGPVGLLDAPRPNLLRYLFTDPRARAAYPDWACVADDAATTLRVECRPDDPHVAALVDELTITAGADFTARWTAAPRLPGRAGTERLVHPDAGELRLSYEILALPDADGQRLVAYLPADDATAAALDHLTGRHPGALRTARPA
jgi:transcriptional regulator with XRE-family HTH domain